MVWQQALYLVNLLCKFVPCDYNFPYPDTSLSEPQAFKDLISIGFDEKDKDNPGSLKIGGGGHGWGWDDKEPDYTDNDPLLAITKSGKLRGYWMRVVGGRKIRAFEGIPYAEPPIGYFRFSEVTPKVAWTGLVRANKKGPKCLQFSQIELKRVVGSEDCLCLNVYSPQIPNSPMRGNMVEKFPVLIFIHGGGFQVGSGNDYGPSYLLQRDLILVTFNYRVGVFGFLSTGNTSSPGNYGLKDQALAIKWVYENIEYFNGDPTRITLIGQEAGAASVHLHMMSSKSRPYFQSAISMSGTAFSPWVFCSKQAAKDLSKYFAKKFHCPVHSSEAILACLRRVDATELAKTQIPFLDDWPIPLYLFRPVIEDIGQKEEPFITESPEELYRKNMVSRIPWIAGFTEDEGLTFLLPSVFRRTIKHLRSNWNHLAPDFLDYEYLKVDQDEVTKKINWLYFKQQTPNTATIRTFSDALSARFTITGVHKALQAHSPMAPTYGYMFSYNGKYNLATLAGIKPHEWGVGQGEDLFYLLNSTHFYQGFKKTDHEMILSKIMVNLFGNFAAKRYPTFTLENHEDFQIWNPITDPRNMSFLLIHKKIKMIPEPYLKQTVYWESIGLPDTTSYINSTEHYRDYHYITPHPPTQRQPNAYYAISNPEVFDLRNNLSHKFSPQSEFKESLSNLNKNRAEDTESGDEFYDVDFLTTTTTNITMTTTPRPITSTTTTIPEIGNDYGMFDSLPTSIPTLSEPEPTSTFKENPDTEDDVFLPPWSPAMGEMSYVDNPLITTPSTTTTTPTTTTATTTPTSIPLVETDPTFEELTTELPPTTTTVSEEDTFENIESFENLENFEMTETPPTKEVPTDKENSFEELPIITKSEEEAIPLPSDKPSVGTNPEFEPDHQNQPPDFPFITKSPTPTTTTPSPYYTQERYRFILSNEISDHEPYNIM